MTLYDIYAKSFYENHDMWETHFNLWREIYHWEKEPTNAMFRRAILARIEWCLKYQTVNSEMIINLALADLQNPKSAYSKNILSVKDARLYASYFKDA